MILRASVLAGVLTGLAGPAPADAQTQPYFPSPVAPAATATAPDASPAPPAPPTGQMPNIADLRADLDALTADLQSLRAALRVSGAAGYQAAGGAAAITRMDAMEAELRRLTGQIEEARNRIEHLTRDSGRVLEDLEFRLCQLEEHCDLAALLTPADGYQPGPVITLSEPPLPEAEPGATTATERVDFETAQALAAAGDHAGAARAFGAVAADHAGGPLFAEARFREGEALVALGDARAASRAWIDVFAADPTGPRVPAALLGVARLVGGEGQHEAACLFLTELTLRFPDRPEAAEATGLRAGFGCDALLAEPDLPADDQ